MHDHRPDPTAQQIKREVHGLCDETVVGIFDRFLTRSRNRSLTAQATPFLVIGKIDFSKLKV